MKLIKDQIYLEILIIKSEKKEKNGKQELRVKCGYFAQQDHLSCLVSVSQTLLMLYFEDIIKPNT